MTKIPDNKNPQDQKPEINFSQVSADDIAKKFLETPPKPKKKEEKQD